MQQPEDKNLDSRPGVNLEPKTSNLDPESKPRSSNLAPPPNPDVINLLDYLEVIAKNWRMIVRTAIIAAVLSVAYSLCLKNIYTATARIMPPQQDTGSVVGALMGAAGGLGGMAGDLLGKGTPSDLYVGILSTEAISDKIIDRFKLMEVYKQDYRVATYKILDKNVDIASGKKDGIISISVEDKDPKLAAAMANAYVEELGDLLSKQDISTAGQNRKYYEIRLAKAKADLAKAEDALKIFQLKNKAIDVTNQAKASIEGVAMLRAQLAVQEAQLSALLSQYTNSTQDVQSIKASIRNLKGQIAQLEGTQKGSSIPSVGSVPDLGQEYIRLTREFKTQEAIVDLLTKQNEMAKLSETKNDNSIQIIQTAREPDKKTKPKRSLIVLATTFAAGFGAVLYAFIREAGERMPQEDRERWNRIRGLLPDISGVIARIRRFKRRGKK
jgi:uncharacterized protein involved in exopolysaccharide biosynthesis